MATAKEYAAGDAAAMKVVQVAIKTEVPSFFQSEVPMDKVQKYIALAVKAAVDAVDAVRAAQPPAPPAAA